MRFTFWQLVKEKGTLCTYHAVPYIYIFPEMVVIHDVSGTRR